MELPLIQTVRILILFGGLLPSASSSEHEQLDGVWRSQGYGYVLSINGAFLTEYEITSMTCVVGFKAKRQTVSSPKWDAVFKSKNEGKLFIRTGGTAGHKLLHLEDSVPDIRIDRITGIPAVCDYPTENTPVGNFEVFTRTFAENYISFDRRKNRIPEDFVLRRLRQA